MIAWATIVALATSVFGYANEASSVFIELGELVGVVALFTLVCAAEAYSTPKG